MSEPVVLLTVDRSASRSYRGQSFVEFALLLPLLLVLFLGVADFGRVFSDGIVLEASARDGAEAAAQEYVQLARTRPGGVLTTADYVHLHDLALSAMCDEGAKLTNREVAGGACMSPGQPTLYGAVCVHDVDATDPSDPNLPGDPGCGSEASAAPSECHRLSGPSAPAWNPSIEQPLNRDAAFPPYVELPYVEVRVCYRFTTLWNLVDLQLPLATGLNLGEVWLQRDRAFVGGDY